MAVIHTMVFIISLSQADLLAHLSQMYKVFLLAFILSQDYVFLQTFHHPHQSQQQQQQDHPQHHQGQQQVLHRDINQEKE